MRIRTSTSLGRLYPNIEDGYDNFDHSNYKAVQRNQWNIMDECNANDDDKKMNKPFSSHENRFQQLWQNACETFHPCIGRENWFFPHSNFPKSGI